MINPSLLHRISYGLYVLGANDGGRPTGCMINTCMQITSESPIFAVSVNKNNYTHDVILNDGRFTVTVLSETVNPDIISKFGFYSGKDTDKYQGFSYIIQDGLAILQEAVCAILIFDVLTVSDMETHSVIFGRLRETVEGSENAPMTYSYYHQVIKGKAPKNAPTYLAEEPSGETGHYVCDICGYVYEGEGLPAEFICPRCKADASHFKKQ